MMHQVSKTNLLEAVHKYKPKIAFGFPTYLKAWIASTNPEDKQYDRSSLEFMATGGIVVQQSFYDEVQSKLPLLKGINNGFG